MHTLCHTNATAIPGVNVPPKTPPLVIEGKKTFRLKNYITPERSAAGNRNTAKITKKTGKTRLMSQRLQIKLQVEAKHRTRLKSLLKTCFQKKGDPF